MKRERGIEKDGEKDTKEELQIHRETFVKESVSLEVAEEDEDGSDEDMRMFKEAIYGKTLFYPI